MSAELIEFIRTLYPPSGTVALHEPIISDIEQRSVHDVLNSGFVSSAGAEIDAFSEQLSAFINVPYAIPVVSGTSALHTALHLSAVVPGDLVITQALTFVATVNAIRYQFADPVFIDVDPETLGLSPTALRGYLEVNALLSSDGRCLHKQSGKTIRACIPVHTLGHPCAFDELTSICQEWGLALIEDAAQALGSRYKGTQVGSKSEFAALSFNGNKIITTGGGGAVLTHSSVHGERVKHITKTARVAGIEIEHDEVGFNYRMPNLNAALGIAQMKRLKWMISRKRELAHAYHAFFKNTSQQAIVEPKECESNYWLNAVKYESKNKRNTALYQLNEAGILARPLWRLMTDLPMFKGCERGDLSVSNEIYDRTLCLPSSANFVMN